MNTKERIVKEALTLFSKHGYQGTSVKNIADAVGIKDSSLYKHFKSKKEIFDTIVQEMSVGWSRCPRSTKLCTMKTTIWTEAAELYEHQRGSGFLLSSEKIFLFYLKDEFASKFRRMLVIEQYRDREVFEVYRGLFMDAAVSYQTELFAEMTARGIFHGKDPKAMAVNFYAPIFFLLNRYDQEPDKEERGIGGVEKTGNGIFEAV